MNKGKRERNRKTNQETDSKKTNWWLPEESFLNTFPLKSPTIGNAFSYLSQTCLFIYLFIYLFIFNLFLRKTECEWRRDTERETQNLKQAPGSELSA